MKYWRGFRGFKGGLMEALEVDFEGAFGGCGAGEGLEEKFARRVGERILFEFVMVWGSR